jgi:hypothetical protein
MPMPNYLFVDLNYSNHPSHILQFLRQNHCFIRVSFETLKVQILFSFLFKQFQFPLRFYFLGLT